MVPPGYGRYAGLFLSIFGLHRPLKTCLIALKQEDVMNSDLLQDSKPSVYPNQPMAR
jgi:hypothetical protein